MNGNKSDINNGLQEMVNGFKQLPTFVRWLLGTGVTLVGIAIYSGEGADFMRAQTPAGLVIDVAMVIVTIWAFYEFIEYGDVKRSINLPRRSWQFVGEIVAVLVLVELLPWLLAQGFELPIQTSDNQTSLLQVIYSSPNGLSLLILYTLGFAPVIEELIFRWLPGKMIGMQWWNLVFFGVFFVFMHGPTTLYQWFAYGTIAAGLEYTAWRWGVKGSITLHLMINLLAVGSLFTL